MRTPSPRVVLVPGLGLDARSSARLRERQPGDVVLLPGMGLPGPVPSLGALVGHSQSCQVVAAAAVDARVQAVVLLGPTTDPRMRGPVTLAWRWLRTAVREPWWQVPLVVAQWWRTGPRAMRALWRVTAPNSIDDRLGDVVVPVVVARGTRDRLCPNDWAARVAAAAPKGRLAEIDGAAHMTVQTHPDAVAALLQDPGGR